MTQFGRRGRLAPQVSSARRALEYTLAQSLGRAPQPSDLILVALSGGPDSLALAAVAAHFSRRRRFRVGAVVVDHQLQQGSAEVAAAAAQQARDLGLEPVVTRAVTVQRGADGLEAAARSARYAVLGEQARATGAHAVLLGHTRDDQAETVLLGLARGSGTRSLAGMSSVSNRQGVQILRPLLEHTRQDTEEICAAEQLQPWMDPTNTDQSFLRARVRHSVLPMLERELGPGVAASLARTAAILGPDADALDEQAQVLLERARTEAVVEVRNGDAQLGETDSVVLSLTALDGQPAAVTRRVLARACVLAGGQPVAHERLEALALLAADTGEAGPVQMAGKVSVYRRRPQRSRRSSTERLRGTLEFRPTD